jgi:hypothetical protein
MTITAAVSFLPAAVCLFSLLVFSVSGFFLPASAIQSVTPWTSEKSFQNLTYGSSSYQDVISAVGQPPDEVVHSDQMYPIIENFYYYDENKTGGATVFVFENGLLVGLQYKSPDNQFVDLSYFLRSNGDRNLHYSALGEYQPYYPYFPLYSMPW